MRIADGLETLSALAVDGGPFTTLGEARASWKAEKWSDYVWPRK